MYTNVISRVTFSPLFARALTVVASLICLTPYSVKANDAMARNEAGGLSFVKSDDVRMVEEILTISTSRVRVQYKFLNEAANPIKSLVAFPLPRYELTNHAGSVNKDRVSFKTKVNGLPTPMRREIKAFLGDKDITQELKALGLSDELLIQGSGNADIIKPKLNSVQAAQLQKWGYSGSNSWEIQETHFWEQVFPEKAMLHIEHEYSPLYGVIYDEPRQIGGFEQPLNRLRLHAALKRSAQGAEACVDESTFAALRRQVKTKVDQGAKHVQVFLQDVEYILGTGNNWKGPISDFTLNLEKARSDQIISLCFPGKPTRLSSTVLQFKQKNFSPPDKLVVYFYTVVADGDSPFKN